jgi:hypothetical protein
MTLRDMNCLMGSQYVNDDYNTLNTFLIFYFIPHALRSGFDCRPYAGDTLSSRHVSSRDVTSEVGIFNIEFWRTITLLSLCLRHVI